MSSPVTRGDIEVGASSCCSDESSREFGGEVVSAWDGDKVGEFADIIYCGTGMALSDLRDEVAVVGAWQFSCSVGSPIS